MVVVVGEAQQTNKQINKITTITIKIRGASPCGSSCRYKPSNYCPQNWPEMLHPRQTAMGGIHFSWSLIVIIVIIIIYHSVLSTTTKQAQPLCGQ